MLLNSSIIIRDAPKSRVERVRRQRTENASGSQNSQKVHANPKAEVKVEKGRRELDGRLGKQTLCQLSYSRSGGRHSSGGARGTPSRHERRPASRRSLGSSGDRTREGARGPRQGVAARRRRALA